MRSMLHPFISQLLLIIVKIVCLLVIIAYYTIAERKIMAAIQRRRGPNVVGFWGLLQPLADGLKLVVKEMVIPSHANSRIFVIAPLCILTLSLLSWSILPFGCFDYSEYATNKEVLKVIYAEIAIFAFINKAAKTPQKLLNHGDWKWGSQFSDAVLWFGLPACPITAFFRRVTLFFLILYSICSSGSAAELAPVALFVLCRPRCGGSFEILTEFNDISDTRYSLLVILAFSSLAVYSLIIAGWASNSKYAFLGALRSAAQMISYEVSISLAILPVISLSGSLNFTEIVVAQDKTAAYIFPLNPLSLIFFISTVAETNRTPFDLPEAEAELVAGYNIEYSSIIFSMFFLGEYGNMTMMSVVKSDLFVGGWLGPELLPSSTNLALKTLFFCFLLVLIRATFPRYRYDQLMDIGWKIFLPVATGLLLLVVGFVITFDIAPVVYELGLLLSGQLQ